MTTMCTVYAVSASDPTAASGARTRGHRSATTRQPAITSSATPTLPTTSNVVDECGSAVASAAGQPSRCSATHEPPCPRITSPTPARAPRPRSRGGAQVAAADREPDQQVGRPHDRRVVVADRDLGEHRRSRALEARRRCACPSGGPSDGDDPRRRQQSGPRPAQRDAAEREQQPVRRQDHDDRRRQDHEELPEGEQQQRPDQDAHARLHEPGAGRRGPCCRRAAPATGRPGRRTAPPADRPPAARSRPEGSGRGRRDRRARSSSRARRGPGRRRSPRCGA